MILSSREEDIGLEGLNDDELKLIAALLYPVRLSTHGTKFAKAALTLMVKIENARGNDFFEEASNEVDMKVILIDDNGDTLDTVDDANVEFKV